MSFLRQQTEQLSIVSDWKSGLVVIYKQMAIEIKTCGNNQFVDNLEPFNSLRHLFSMIWTFLWSSKIQDPKIDF